MARDVPAMMALVPAGSPDAGGLASVAADAGELYLRDDGQDYLVLLRQAPAVTAAPLVPLQSRFVRGRHGPNAGPWLLQVGLWVPAEHRVEFLAWYQQEHVPMLLECPQWEGCRFMEAPAASGCQFHALHQLAERSALSSPERAASRSTPWFNRFKAFDWFDEAFTRALYRRIDR